MRIAVGTIGSRAERMMEAAGEGIVIAVFDRSFYIEVPEGDVVCVGSEDLGHGPLNALFAGSSFDFAALDAGTLVMLDLAHASVWRHQPLRTVNVSDLRCGLAAIKKVMADRIRPRGLAAQTGNAGLDALGAWIENAVRGEAQPFSPVLENLIGLGAGLTPSGDDALAGALIALNESGNAGAAAALAERVLPLARLRTNKISFAHLAAAADGEGGAPIHDSLAALASADESDIALSLARIDRIGHTSGWDAVAGILVAIASLVRACADLNGE